MVLESLSPQPGRGEKVPLCACVDLKLVYDRILQWGYGGGLSFQKFAVETWCDVMILFSSEIGSHSLFYFTVLATSLCAFAGERHFAPTYPL